MAEGVLSVWLGSNKARWDKHCAAQGAAPSTLIRRAIERELDGPAESPRLRQIRTTPDDEKTARFEIVLTESERAWIAERAAADQCSGRDWVARLIRASLTREAQPSLDEVAALGASNGELRRIASGLREMARRLDEVESADDTARAATVKLATRIDRHIALVRRTIRASAERWTIG